MGASNTPIRLRGFGMTLLQTVSRFAFLSSWGRSLQELPTWFTYFPGRSCQDSFIKLQGEEKHWYQLDQLLDDAKDLSEVVSNTKKLQHRLTDANNQITVNALIDSSSKKRCCTSAVAAGKESWGLAQCCTFLKGVCAITQ